VKPIEPETVTAAAATTEAEAPKETAAASPTVETPAGKDKRRTSFFGNFGKKKGDSDNEGAEADKAKGNKPFGLFRKPSKAAAVKLDKETAAADKAEDKVEPAAQETSAEAAPVAEASQPAEAPATEEAKPATVAATSTPVQAAA
jgi:hypothetical protein